jgi:peptide/nickel transport system substrate-binding protein
MGSVAGIGGQGSELIRRSFFPWILLLSFALCCSQQREEPLRIVHQSAVVSLDPQTTDDFTSLSVLSNVYETLLRLDENLHLLPALAVSWSNPDENTWRFELRRNVTFQDGRPFTALDVKYTIDRGIQDPASFIKAEIPEVQETRVIDDHTVDVITSKPFPLLLVKMAYIMIIPRGSESYVQKRCVGTGPYRLTSYLPGKQVVLERFDQYWGHTPRWKRALITWNADAQARLKEVQEGRADIVDDPPKVDLSDSRTVQVIQHSSLTVMLLGFSVKSGPQNPFSDLRVRRAVSLSIDRAALIAKALAGRADAVSQLAPPGVFGFVSDLPLPETDQAQAKRLLAEAGFPNGFRRPLYFVDAYKGVAAQIAEQVRPLGISLDLQETDRAGMDKLLFDQNAPAYVLRYSFPSLDSSDLLYFGFHTMTPDRSFGVLNFSGYSDPALDGILESSATQMDLRERYLLLKEGMQKAMESNVWIPLCVRLNLFAASRKIRWNGNSLGRVTLEEISPAE